MNLGSWRRMLRTGTGLDRDAARLRAELKEARAELSRLRSAASAGPSFFFKYNEIRRRRKIAQRGVQEPSWSVNRKDAGYEFARSHGVVTPEVFFTYRSPDEIEWSALPDEFVIKTLDGTFSRGVFPLVQRDGKYIDLLDVKAPPVSSQDLLDIMRARRESRKVGSALLVEELLWSPHGGREVAADMKLYCFYGRVGLIMARDTHGSRMETDFRVRFFSTDGEDMGDAFLDRKIDPGIPAPLHLEELVQASSQLSGALPVPFVRLDFFERVEGVVFGEITLVPGGHQQPRRDVDRLLGELWEDADARLRAELISAGMCEPRYGSLNRRQDAKAT